MPGHIEDDWGVSDGSFGIGDGELFPEAIQKRIEDSYRKQGWCVPGEQRQEGQSYGPGCGIGKGWLPILVELDEVLVQIDPDYEIHQIKEKFGGLRYYAQISGESGSHWDQEAKKRVIDDIEAFIRYEAFHAQISSAERKCGMLCEVCGEFGKISGPKGIPQGGWQRCRCEKHAHG